MPASFTSTTRRRLLHGAAAAFAAANLPSLTRAQDGGSLRVAWRTIEVGGKPARVFGITRGDGAPGWAMRAGEAFNPTLENATDQDTIIHWHGLTPPFGQDGISADGLIRPGERRAYGFPVDRPGTHWMHSHHGLQEARLMAAPLIVRERDAATRDEQEIVMMLHDFTFAEPEEVLAGLRQARASAPHGAGPAMAMGAPDINDLDFDAYLANDRTLDDPQVVRVRPGQPVRLRVINGAAGTNFVIDLGPSSADLTAVDGNPVVPLRASRFDVAIGQRLDLVFRMPSATAAIAALARREGAVERTGLIIATPDAAVRRLAAQGEGVAPILATSFEAGLVSPEPLAARAADRRVELRLTGSMERYVWTLDDRPYGEHRPVLVRAGERVELTLTNGTPMSHPMHLHGHRFQVAAVGGRRIRGALRDTVLVPGDGSVTIAFDADNPGEWPLHCHNFFHLAAGMMTTLRYA